MNVRISFNQGDVRRKYTHSTRVRRERAGGFPRDVEVHVYEAKGQDALELTGRELCAHVNAGCFTDIKELPGPTVDCGCNCGPKPEPASQAAESAPE